MQNFLHWMIGGNFVGDGFPVLHQWAYDRWKMLATQGILTYGATDPLPYHLYADEGRLLVLAPPLTSDSLAKTYFCQTAKPAAMRQCH